MISPSNLDVETIWIRALQPYMPTVTIVNSGELQGENRPKPDEPYLVLGILSGPRFAGEDELRESDVAGDFRIENIVYYLLSLQVIGTTSDVILSNLAQGLFTLYYKANGTPNLAMKLNEEGIAVQARGDIMSLDEQINTGFERRSTMEVHFSLVYEVAATEDGGTIDSATYSGQVDDRIIPETKVEP